VRRVIPILKLLKGLGLAVVMSIISAIQRKIGCIKRLIYKLRRGIINDIKIVAMVTIFYLE